MKARRLEVEGGQSRIWVGSARVWLGSLGNVLINVGAGLSPLGAFCFIYNIWRTLGPVRTPRLARAGGRERATPTARATPTGGNGNAASVRAG